MVELERVGINGNNSIKEIATLNPLFCFEKEKIKNVAKKLAETFHRSMPVVDGSKNLKGMVTITDIMDAFLKNEDFEQEIERIMSREVVYCEENESIRYVLQKMKIAKRGRLPILKSRKLIGIISETDFLKKSRDFSPFSQIKIEDVMTKKPFFIMSSNTIHETLRIMVNAKYRRLPIIENGKIIGYITSTRFFSELVKNNFSKDFLSLSISKIMTKNPIFVESQESLEKALRIMKDNDISSILVVKKDKLEGIFTERDYINLIE